jgi:hypothetical protein
MQQDTGKWLWLEWALATLSGYVVGALLALLAAVPLAYSTSAGWLANAAGGAVIGGVVGAAQWLVLRRSSVGRAGSAGLWWVLASLAGGLVGLALGTALGDLLAPALVQPAADRAAAARMIPLNTTLSTAVSGLVFGLLLGGAQWFALRRPARAAGWWLAANGLGWMLGLALGAAAAVPISVIGGMLTSGAVAGVITGAALQRFVWPAINRTAP